MQLVPARRPRSVWRTLTLFFAALLAFGVLVPVTASANSPAQLRVRDRSVVETNVASKTVNVRVVLSRVVHRRVSVGYATVDGTAKAGRDYVATSGRAYFPAGNTVAFVPVTVKGDLLDENNEFFKVRIFDAHRAVIADRVGVVTILDNDPKPALSINDVTVTEGDDATLSITLSAPSGRFVEVHFATLNGTATAGEDYVAKSGTITFTRGDTLQKVTIVTKDDSEAGSEAFHVRLTSATNATISDAVGIVTLTATP